MGATTIITGARGRNMREAFDNAVKDADDYYGHQEGYSGSINTCSLTKDVTHLYKSMGRNKLEDHIIENTNKREVWGYCIEEPKTNNNKIKSVVENYPQHGTRKWKTIYQAVDEWSGDVKATADSQTECIKKARAYVEKNPDTTLVIKIAKVLETGNQKCAKVKYKKATNERLGKYVFVGWAAM